MTPIEPPASRAGAQRPLSFSPLYAAAETMADVHAGARTAAADAAADIWALGVMALELTTYEPAFPLLATRATIGAMLRGEQPLPWEVGGGARDRLAALRRLRPTVERCLSRDPAARPAAAELVAAWDDGMFDAPPQ